MKKVSVIITMYNAESYIRQCMQSVMSQTWDDLEILVIDDGSADQGLKICEELGRMDGRIQILTQKNRGVSAARNRGIEEADGEYIFFLDSDDVIHPCLIEALVRGAERFQAGMTFCSYVRLDDREMEERLCRDSENKDTALRKERLTRASEKERAVQRKERLTKTSENACTIRWETAEQKKTEEWFHIRFERELSGIGGKMIRRECIGRQRFYERLASGEDTIFLYDLCRRQVKLAFADAEWYYYRIHPDSVTHSYDMSSIRQKLRVYERIRDQEIRIGHQGWALKWERGLVWNILSMYLVMRNRKVQKNSRYLKKRMLLEMRNPVYRQLSAGMKVLFFGLLAGCSFPPFRALWVMKQKICHTY